MAKPRTLDWPDCLNVRDLGGLPTVDGRRLAAGALIRSDNLSRLSAAGVAVVRESRVSRVVDVRSPAECEHDPSPFAVDLVAGEPRYVNRPLNRPGDPWDPALSLGANYVATLDRNPDLYAAAVEAIAADYAAVSDRMLALFDEWLAADPAARAQLAEELSSRPATMITLLDHLDAGYGGAEEYLRRGGLGDQAVDRLQARLL